MNKITSQEQYDAAIIALDILLKKGFSRLTDAEESQMDELSDAIEVWESVHFPMPMAINKEGH